MTAFVIVVIAAVVALVGWAFVRASLARRGLGAVLAVAVTAAAVATLFEDHVTGERQDLLAMFALVLAVCGGAVVTLACFAHIDAAAPDAADSIEAAGDVLRGGAWIGALERLAVFGTLAARWPEGVAIALAVKGLGRYPELRAKQSAAATERFIIGTMVSMGWAALCIYVAFAPYTLGSSPG